jgi:hypothetical protein
MTTATREERRDRRNQLAHTRAGRDQLASEWEAAREPDQAEAIYRYADGWTIRNITRLADVKRESALLRHCLYLALTMPDGRGIERLASLGLLDEHRHLVSLRDATNYPRATYVYDARRQEMERLDTTEPLFPRRYRRRTVEFATARVPQIAAPEQLFLELANLSALG